MKLYLITQDVHNDYDTYSDAVVSAESEEDAKTIHPDGDSIVTTTQSRWSTWSAIEDVVAEYLGETEQPRGVICASFHAG